MEEHRKENSPAEEDRRAFLKACGRFAAITPPAVTMLLSTSLTSNALAASGAGGGSNVGKGGRGGNSAKGGKGGNGTKGGKGGNNAKGKAKPGK
ncbi:hypothetical protein [Sinorhizobium medicae]|uniref:hypothetical protein n=1 Tax=Sinorhizobium medicae TaxID=110321 RepID=UPI000FD7DB0B|nr:hypothetical protein [Sinorhizobium medicae]RVJ72251.1 hypothetical protein CN168_27340 [Sinorhizobium medicae]